MKAYAAVENGTDIMLDTVSSHERAAMVNWLVTRAGFMVPQGMGDFAIREHFARLADGVAKIEPVEVTYGA